MQNCCSSAYVQQLSLCKSLTGGDILGFYLPTTKIQDAPNVALRAKTVWQVRTHPIKNHEYPVIEWYATLFLKTLKF